MSSSLNDASPTTARPTNGRTPVRGAGALAATITPETPQTNQAGRTRRPVEQRNALARQIDSEWVALVADRSHDVLVRSWGTAEPALAELGTLQEVREACRNVGNDTVAADALLTALLRLHHAGDQLAGRTVLQAMHSQAVKVTNLAARRTGEDIEEVAGLTYAALWQLIATYPLERRPRSVAANLALDLRKEVTVHGGRALGCSTERHTRLHLDHVDGSAALDEHRLRLLGQAEAGTTSGTISADLIVDARALLLRARAAGVITHDQAALLRDLYSPDHDDKTSQEAVAEAWGITWATMRQRAARAVRRIALWVAAGAETPQPALHPHAETAGAHTKAAATPLTRNCPQTAPVSRIETHARWTSTTRRPLTRGALGPTAGLVDSPAALSPAVVTPSTRHQLSRAGRHCTLLGERTERLMGAA